MFPFDENVVEALHLFKKQDVDYIQLVNIYTREREREYTLMLFIMISF